MSILNASLILSPIVYSEKYDRHKVYISALAYFLGFEIFACIFNSVLGHALPGHSDKNVKLFSRL